MSFIVFFLKFLLVVIIIVAMGWGLIWGGLMLYGLIIHTVISAWGFVLEQQAALIKFRNEIKERKKS